MRLALALVGLVACSSPPEPQRPPVAPPAPKPIAAKPAPVSCGDAGVLLRGKVDDDKLAGPEKEAAIARACLRGKWSEEVLTCIGSAREPKSCLGADQNAGYLKQLAAWNNLFPDEEVAELDRRHTDEDPGDPVDCITATASSANLTPKLTQTGADLNFAMAIRADAVELACEDWSNAVRTCFADAVAATIDSCRNALEPDQKKVLADKIADSDALLAKIAALVFKPAAADCAKVVAVHYSDAEWRARGPTTTPKMAGLRRKMIADSRAAMRKACATEKWSGYLRACVVAGARDKCFLAASESMARWSFPAAGVIVKTKIPECDAYGATLAKLASCDKMPKRSIEALQGTFAQQAAGYATGTAAERAAAAPHCKQANEAIRRAAQTFNCTI
jgi:hypothetical protein